MNNEVKMDAEFNLSNKTKNLFNKCEKRLIKANKEEKYSKILKKYAPI
jgi:hypothetical protein